MDQKDFDYDNVDGRMQLKSIVCHELGHWKSKDNFKQLIFQIIKFYLQFAMFSLIIIETNMPKSFGVEAHPIHGKSVFFSLLTFAMLLSPVSVLLELIRIAFIRHIEFKADKFATD